jgi:hypothetical protein
MPIMSISLICLISISSTGFEFAIEVKLTIVMLSILAFVSFLLSLKYRNYLNKSFKAREKCIKEVESETQNMSETEFKEYIEQQKNLENKEGKSQLEFLTQEIVFKGNFNKKSVATEVYEERFNLN